MVSNYADGISSVLGTEAEQGDEEIEALTNVSGGLDVLKPYNYGYALTKVCATSVCYWSRVTRTLDLWVWPGPTQRPAPAPTQTQTVVGRLFFGGQVW